MFCLIADDCCYFICQCFLYTSQIALIIMKAEFYLSFARNKHCFWTNKNFLFFFIYSCELQNKRTNEPKQFFLEYTECVFFKWACKLKFIQAIALCHFQTQNEYTKKTVDYNKELFPLFFICFQCYRKYFTVCFVLCMYPIFGYCLLGERCAWSRRNDVYLGKAKHQCMWIVCVGAKQSRQRKKNWKFNYNNNKLQLHSIESDVCMWLRTKTERLNAKFNDNRVQTTMIKNETSGPKRDRHSERKKRNRTHKIIANTIYNAL